MSILKFKFAQFQLNGSTNAGKENYKRKIIK